MKLTLIGHDYKYAVEQMLLTLFPGQRPEYPDTPPAPGEDALISTLSLGKVWATAAARLTVGGQEVRASCRCPLPPEGCDPLERDRALQRILKEAFYRAGTRLLGKEPPWGALTGVRPVKLPTRVLREGGTPRDARRALIQTYSVSPRRADLAVACAQASLAADRALSPRSVSVYVGIPFCPTRCAYCSFVSADVGRALKLLEPYLQALLQEVAATGALLRELGLGVHTLYLGGGTPTTLSAGQLDRLLSALEEQLPLAGCSEITVEAGRPDTITLEKLRVLRAHGVERISINPQSLSDRVLEAIGRRHTARDILDAYALARGEGFSCINMDLIAGLPQDSLAGFRDTLAQVLALRPENLTVHTLALKKGSGLMGGGVSIPGGEEVAAMLEHTLDALPAAHYRPYYLYRQKYMSGALENVGWTLPGQESIYNIVMMEELETVLALGGGGVTKIVDRSRGSIVRQPNPKYPHDYLATLDRVLEQKGALASLLAP